MKPELFDSELKIMKTLWKHGDCTAGQMAKLLKDEIGWNRNTAYTVIKKCIEKGAVIRLEPNLLCRAAVTRQEIRAAVCGCCQDGAAGEPAGTAAHILPGVSPGIRSGEWRDDIVPAE